MAAAGRAAWGLAPRHPEHFPLSERPAQTRPSVPRPLHVKHDGNVSDAQVIITALNYLASQ